MDVETVMSQPALLQAAASSWESSFLLGIHWRFPLGALFSVGTVAEEPCLHDHRGTAIVALTRCFPCNCVCVTITLRSARSLCKAEGG